MTSPLKIVFFSNLHYLTEDNRFLLKRKPVSDLPYYKNFHLFTINAFLHNLFIVRSQKVLIAQTLLNALSGDIIKVFLIKTTLHQLMFI